MSGIEAMAPRWRRVTDLQALRRKGRLLVRPEGRQIALFLQPDGTVLACNNRCPHEGYPLLEGSLNEACILTCNWHNWKFDLNSGETLTGGDRLRRYPVRLRDGAIELDLSDAPAETRIAAALGNLRDAMRRNDYGRMGREIARLLRAGGDPLEAVRAAIRDSYERLEFGATHAQAAAPDWLQLGAQAEDPADRLAPLLEVVAHFAWDVRGEPPFPYPDGSAPFDAAALVQAIEAEDEPAAVAQVRGALQAGLGWEALEESFTAAALAHYQDFGHALIYVLKTGQLLRRLGPSMAEPLLLSLTRSLVNASREDLIPEFRAYAPALAAWSNAGPPLSLEAVKRGSVRRVLAQIAAAGGPPEAVYHTLLHAAAWQLLHFDATWQDRTDGTVSQNVGWLDFTHAVTFANAVRRQCGKFPQFWPQGLLQIGCFLGRNAAFVDAAQDVSAWRVADREAWLAARRRRLFDHGQSEPIVSAHLAKLLFAAADELAAAPGAPWADDLAAAVERFMSSPLKRRHLRRTAAQSLAFVAAE